MEIDTECNVKIGRPEDFKAGRKARIKYVEYQNNIKRAPK